MSGPSSLTIHSSTGEYEVLVAPGAFGALLSEKPDALLIVDERFAADAALAGRSLLTVTADERHKTLGEVERLLVGLREAGAGRSNEIIAVGGGVIQDTATLSAQLYMRGIPWSYVPTTLLGMVDSCIGGKSSINAGAFKNLVGSFYPPRHIVVDPQFVTTLPDEAIAGGLAEALKITYCRGGATFERHLELVGRFDADPVSVIRHSLDTKRWFIEADEFDTGPRRLLNFGHTFGHALEAASGFAVSHGIAVALGILAAERFGAESGLGVEDPVLREHATALARRAADLSTARMLFDAAAYERAFAADKKHGPDGLHVILPAASGAVAEIVVPRTPEMMALARTVTEQVLATVVR